MTLRTLFSLNINENNKFSVKEQQQQTPSSPRENVWICQIRKNVKSCPSTCRHSLWLLRHFECEGRIILFFRAVAANIRSLIAERGFLSERRHRITGKVCGISLLSHILQVF